jgi:two-component system cell cycle response regulator
MNHDARPRLILIDSSDATREVLATRLRAQGYQVDAVGDAAAGAELSLSAPPSVVVADLWMPSISGVQICRLLRSEPATADVPVILRGERDDPKSRFWAERAGAAAYVLKGRMGDLVRALIRATASPRESDGFFMQLGGGSLGIRDRIAQHLDAALFESVIAAEVRALASAGSFERFFDLLSQLLAQLCAYRWLAVATIAPTRFAIHRHPKLGDISVEEARQALGVTPELEPLIIEDEDALESADPDSPIVVPITFASAVVGNIAFSPAKSAAADAAILAPILARELGGPLRMTALIEESQRLASIDPLTGLFNRRAFAATIDVELSRCARHGYPLSLMLLDVDHFKIVNDHWGHAAGDQVLAAIGAMLRRTMRRTDVASRWGGEEFVLAMPSTPLAGGRVAAERVRRDIEALTILDHEGQRIAVSASVGLVELQAGESLARLVDRADKAMYGAKVGGRNRVVADDSIASAPSGAANLDPSSVQSTDDETPPSPDLRPSVRH